MMEAEIRARVMHLHGAVVNKDDKAALDAGIALATQVIVDLNRIATALEHLAKRG